ncbi:MAG: glycosyltransferase family 2 protein [Prevotellaceae bacterium]|nr:glycosyltransferase family 2 protein [Prevotellaceae bacterium]
MKISIITICKNDLEGLRKTSESVNKQSLQDYEWIVIDGGSNDGTAEFLRNSSNNIAFWCSEPDKGIYNAMNKGIAKAHGEYLLFLNSGDALHSVNTLQQAVDFGLNTDIIYGDAWFVKGRKSFKWIYDDDLTMKRLYDYSINHQSTFIRTSLLKGKGYDESYKIAADWKKFVEWMKEKRTFQHLPIIVSDYDTTGISTINEALSYKERDRFFSELYPEEVIDVLKDWRTFQNKPCLLTRQFCEENRLFKRLIRSNLHFISWIRHLF